MPRYLSHCALLAALAAAAHGGILVESIDGSFVPLNFAARAPADAIAVLLKNNNDLSYLTNVLMGTPPQQIRMAPSLSQNHISVASAPQGSNDRSFYNPAASSSFVQSSASATVGTISGGTINGQFAGEICTIQSATNSLSFKYNASVVLTDPAVTNDLYPDGAKAVLGYGVDAPADSPQGTSLIGTFLPANFTQAVCGIELNHFDDPVPDGILTMGATDQSAFSGDFTNVNVPATPATRPSWSIPFDNITYPCDGVNETTQGALASVDIYHTGIDVTPDMAKAVYSGIPGAQAVSDTKWSLPCNSTFPITLSFAGRPFTIYERDTVVKQLDGTCTGVVTGGAAEILKIGAAFLRNVYTQFGAVKDSNGNVTFNVGFATKNLRQTSAIPSKGPSTTIGPSATHTTVFPSSSSSATGTSDAPTMIVQNAAAFSLIAAVLIASTLAF